MQNHVLRCKFWETYKSMADIVSKQIMEACGTTPDGRACGSLFSTHWACASSLHYSTRGHRLWLKILECSGIMVVFLQATGPENLIEQRCGDSLPCGVGEAMWWRHAQSVRRGCLEFVSPWQFSPIDKRMGKEVHFIDKILKKSHCIQKHAEGQHETPSPAIVVTPLLGTTNFNTSNQFTSLTLKSLGHKQ